jgi:hypothetical protein
MDGWTWLIAGGVFLLLVLVGAAVAPRLHRASFARQLRGEGGALGGVGAGLDSVWRPSAEESHADWEASVEMPAPAPLAGDKGRIDGERIVIRVSDD